jgi:hypothetical protein
MDNLYIFKDNPRCRQFVFQDSSSPRTIISPGPFVYNCVTPLTINMTKLIVDSQSTCGFWDIIIFTNIPMFWDLIASPAFAR